MFKMPTDFGKLFNAAPVDFKALADIQQKNIDAFVAANTKLVEGAQAVLKRQAEMVQGAVKEGLEAARENFAPANLGKVEKQVEFLKSSAEKSVSNAREIAELAGKSSSEAIEILRKRTSESVSELSQLVKVAA